jgi:hypothetical protein
MVTENFGGLQTYNWWGAANQRWVFSPMGDGKYRLAPSSVWWRAMALHPSHEVALTDYTYADHQHWVLIKV